MLYKSKYFPAILSLKIIITYLKKINFDLLSKSISVHYDGLLENTNNDIDVIAKSIYGHIYFIKHKKYPIYGIQSHPEASIETINNCIKGIFKFNLVFFIVKPFYHI